MMRAEQKKRFGITSGVRVEKMKSRKWDLMPGSPFFRLDSGCLATVKRNDG